MSTEAQQVLASAMQLPDADRAEVAAKLIHSLDPRVDEDYLESWHDEIARRLDQYDRGTMQAKPWEVAVKEIAGPTNEAAAH